MNQSTLMNRNSQNQEHSVLPVFTSPEKYNAKHSAKVSAKCNTQYDAKVNANIGTSPEKYSDQVLLGSVKRLVGEERRIGLEILRHLSEISRRRLYSSLGYQSLFDYCVRELRYSEGAAQRRVLATRALQSVPEASEALRLGQVSVTTLALFQEMSQRADVQENNKAPLLKEIYGLSKTQSEKKLFALTGVQSKQVYEKKKTISATQTQVTFTLSQTQLQMLELAKGRLAHRLKEGTYAELITLLAKMAIEQTTPKVKATSLKKEGALLENKTTLPNEGGSSRKYKTAPPNKGGATRENKTPAGSRENTRAIAKSLRAKVWAKAKSRCEKCQSTYALQIDHKTPYSFCGNSGPENLRLLCRHCNLAEAKKWGIG